MNQCAINDCIDSLCQYYNLKIYEMIDIHSKYDNMHKNRMFYAKICINNHIIQCINYMLSWIQIDEEIKERI